MVPHTERSNTACFLEEVLKYIDALKSHVVELESTLQAIRSGKSLPTSRAGGSGHGGPSGPRAVTKAEQLTHGAQLGPGQHHPLMGYSIQQHLQQQHEAAFSAMQEEQKQQMAILAMQQLKNQRDILPPKGLGSGHPAGVLGHPDASAQGAVDYLESAKGVRGVNFGAGPSTPSTSLHLPPVPQLQMPPLDGSAVPEQVSLALPTSDDIIEKDKDGSATTSPTTSEENGVPLKKRKVLLL